MPVNPSIEAPTLVTIDTGGGDQTFGQKTLRGLDVWAAGDVHIADVLGNETTRTFAAPFPVRWIVQIGTVFADSTVDDSDLDGLQ